MRKMYRSLFQENRGVSGVGEDLSLSEYSESLYKETSGRLILFILCFFQVN